MKNRNHILITGATDGIGRELAHIFTVQGANVFALGRRPFTDLDDPPFPLENYIEADLAGVDSAEIVTRFFAERQIDRLDCLIHNAGAGYYGSVGEQSAESIDRLIDVNLWAPIALTHGLIPLLRPAHGKLVFISSVVAGLAGADYAVYTATKSGLEGFARALRVELAGAVDVQVIRPGATQTGMHAKMGLTTAEMDWRTFPPAAEVAQKIAAAVADSDKSRTIGVSNGMLYTAGRWLSGPVDFGMRRSREGADLAPGNGKRWVITGAADGIGRALTEAATAAGYAVLGVDVDAVRASAVAEATGADFVQADLMTRAGWETAVDGIRPFAPVSTIVHNAGISCAARFDGSDLARQRQVFDLNLRAPLQMTAAVLRDRLLAADGTLVFVSSLSRHVGYPGAAVYAATKDALAAYARSLRVALGTQANALTIYPGPTRTIHARRYSPDNSREAKRMPPEKLAGLVVSAVEKRQGSLIPGAGNKVIALVGTVAPAVTDRAMQKTILQKMDEADV